ncbi:MAG: 23S rRNA (pseudouridine(1915)-N(3))-methyltransferase RlmH, partial [Jhaorihella sp.]
MRLSVICVGGKMPAWVDAGVEEYSKRLPRELKLLWRELPLARRGRDSKAEALRQSEGEQILRAIPEGDRVIALDV